MCLQQSEILADGVKITLFDLEYNTQHTAALQTAAPPSLHVNHTLHLKLQ